VLSVDIPPARAGHGRIVARNVRGETVLAVARASSPLRFVRTTSGVCLVTFGAGLKDGDAIELDVEVDEGATLVLFTQASTKVFRGRSMQAMRAHVRGTLIALPDPVAPFQGAEYTQRVDVDLEGPDARCVLLDGVTSGRPAYGERWAFERVDLRTIVRREGRVLLHDGLHLDARDGSIARRMDRFEALLTLVTFGVEPNATDEVDDDVVVATSPHVVRVAAKTPERALTAVRARLGHLPHHMR